MQGTHIYSLIQMPSQGLSKLSQECTESETLCLGDSQKNLALLSRRKIDLKLVLKQDNYYVKKNNLETQ